MRLFIWSTAFRSMPKASATAAGSSPSTATRTKTCLVRSWTDSSARSWRRAIWSTASRQASSSRSAATSSASAGGAAHFFRALRDALESLEALQPAFRAQLLRALDVPAEGRWSEPETLWEQLLCYGIYKYFPRAAFDRAIWPAAVFCVTLPLLLRQLLAAGGQDALRLSWQLSRELEHSEENMAALLQAFSRRAFRPNVLTGIFASIPD